MTGASLSEEAKGKMSRAMKSAWQDADYRQRMLAAQIIGKGTKKAKKNYSAAIARRWADEGQRAKLSAERKARWADPEYRAKMLAIRREQGKRFSGENWRDRPKKEKQNARA